MLKSDKQTAAEVKKYCERLESQRKGYAKRAMDVFNRANQRHTHVIYAGAYMGVLLLEWGNEGWECRWLNELEII